MKILNYFETENKTYWLNEIKKCDWEEGQYLYNLLEKNELKIIFGKDAKVLLLVDNNNLISFCVYAIQPGKRNLKFLPWIGFLYTFPKFRGKKRAGKLLEYIYIFAKNENEEHTYITTNLKGIYEKYGYTLFETKKDNDGKSYFVYRNDI